MISAYLCSDQREPLASEIEVDGAALFSAPAVIFSVLIVPVIGWLEARSIFA